MTLTLEPNRAISIDIEDGGTLNWGSDAKVPETFGRTETGALLGPLEFGVPEEDTLVLSRVSFGPGENGDEDDDSGFLPLQGVHVGGATVAGGGLVAAGRTAHGEADGSDSGRNTSGTTVDPPRSRTLGRLTRRDTLGLFGAIAAGIGLAATGTDTASANEEVTISLATVTVEDVDGPWSLRVLDLVDDVLPPTTELLVDQDGTRVGSVSDATERTDIQPDSGEVRIYVRDSLGNLTRLLAWVSSFLNVDDELRWERTLPNGNRASDYDEGDIIRLTEHPAIVTPVDEAGHRSTRLTIGETEIPHHDENGSDEPGEWDILGDAIVYEPGSNPPASSEWSIETRLGPIARTFG